LVNKNRFSGKIITEKPSNLGEYDLIIDGLFGTGLSRLIDKSLNDIIFMINSSGIPVYSIDIPSGINGDSSSILGNAIKAMKTITFFNKKKCHYLYPGKTYCGEIHVEEIGIKKKVFDKINPMIMKNSPDIWIDEFPFPTSADHKYSRGMVLINSGPVFKTGAARLAGRSAMRVGAGAVKLICNEEAAIVLEPQISIELLSVIKNKNDFQLLLKDKKISSVLVGPGNGVSDETKSRTLMALAFVDHVVIDADAITSFEGSSDELFIDTYEHTILTPHEGEFTRLFGPEVNKIEDKVLRTLEAAKIAGSIVVLKGSDTVIASPKGEVVINSSEAPYLATAGSGDVLAGIIASLVGQNKMTAFNAACAGTWIHSELGRLIGPGLIADDLIDNIPLIIKKLNQRFLNDT
tara:strand:- start:681 stop:1898 length:1218 start_codon:yes stop_codon:yes gene_type:complete